MGVRTRRYFLKITSLDKINLEEIEQALRKNFPNTHIRMFESHEVEK